MIGEIGGPRMEVELLNAGPSHADPSHFLTRLGVACGRLSRKPPPRRRLHGPSAWLPNHRRRGLTKRPRQRKPPAQVKRPRRRRLGGGRPWQMPGPPSLRPRRLTAGGEQPWRPA